MPTFDFQCKACQAIFEHTRPFGSNQFPKCPKCNSKRTEKLLTPPAIHFKGTGFYKTDSSKTSKTEPKSVEPSKEAPKDTPSKPKKEAPKSQNSSAQTSEKKL